MSSNPDDTILDPFCGCGTTVEAAERLGRRWVGIDVTHYAVTLIESRMRRTHPSCSFTVKGRPTDFEGARDLARRTNISFSGGRLGSLALSRIKNPKRVRSRHRRQHLLCKRTLRLRPGCHLREGGEICLLSLCEISGRHRAGERRDGRARDTRPADESDASRGRIRGLCGEIGSRAPAAAPNHERRRLAPRYSSAPSAARAAARSCASRKGKRPSDQLELLLPLSAASPAFKKSILAPELLDFSERLRKADH